MKYDKFVAVDKWRKYTLGGIPVSIVRTMQANVVYSQICFSDKIPLLEIPDSLKCQPQFGLNVFRFSTISLLSSEKFWKVMVKPWAFTFGFYLHNILELSRMLTWYDIDIGRVWWCCVWSGTLNTYILNSMKTCQTFHDNRTDILIL